MAEVLTRNGVRTWQTVSGAAIAIAVSAVGWNYAEIHHLDLAVAHLADITAPAAAISEMQRADSELRDQLVVIRARQDEVMKRLDRIENLLRPEGGAN